MSLRNVTGYAKEIDHVVISLAPRLYFHCTNFIYVTSNEFHLTIQMNKTTFLFQYHNLYGWQ